MEEGPYKLIAEIHAHDGPVRSLCRGPIGEIFSGCQSNSPTARRWSINYENQIDGVNVKVDEIGNAIFHDNWVTAVASLPANPVSVLPEGCLVTGCMDNIIRIYDTIGNPLMNLEGHTKGIISFSWSIEGYLLSGSWDGSAKVWDLKTGLCLFTLGCQENGVRILGCNNGHIATVSTGESVNSKPANFKLRIWDISNSSSPKIINTYEDHNGSIRSITSINVGGLDGFATTSNDGSVRLHTLDGVNIGSMYHTLQINGEEGLPFVLNCDGINTSTGMGLVSGGEDGSVMVWEGTELVQKIPHPSCVWCILGLKETDGDFVTGSHDGIIRIFSKDPCKTEGNLSIQLQEKLSLEINEAMSKRRKGPSEEEISKSAKWNDRSLHPGKSEGHVMVFNKDGKMIAAQWEALSAAWIEIGEVSGKGDGGNVNGVIFDHVFPVEIDTPNGIMTLNLGYNNLENPFDAAQRFINDNSLGQGHLRQIADYIISRAGKNVPTIGETSNQTTSVPKSYETIPVRFVAVHDEIPPLNKLVTKLLQFNTEQTLSEITLSESNIESINSLVIILEDTSHYHSSTVSTNMLLPIFKISEWDINKAFPAMDLARLVAFHPSGAAILAKNNKLKLFLARSIRFLSEGIDKSSSATVLTTLRFIINTFKHEVLRKEIMDSEILISILSSLEMQYTNSNAKIRMAISTFCMNIAASFNQIKENIKHDLSTLIFKIIYNQLNFETESEDVILRSVSTLGTIYLIGDESIKNILNTNSIFSSKSMKVTLNDLCNKRGTKLNSTTSKCIKEVLDLIIL